MPELPEVEHGRVLAEEVACGRTIEKVICARDEIVYDGISRTKVRRVLAGRTIKAVHRRGKHIWFELDKPPHPLFHFGMTGAFHSPNHEPLKLASSGDNEETEWPPKFAKIHFYFDDGGELVMVNKRRLGRIRLRENPPDEPPLSKLGFDPLDDLPEPKKFAEALQKRNAPVKAVLMDQKFAAGVGNWVADEVLFQAKIDPRRKANSLTDAEAKRIRTKLRHVCAHAVKAGGVKSKFPKSWLFHYRWGRNKAKELPDGSSIKTATVGGRRTAFVPKVQK